MGRAYPFLDERLIRVPGTFKQVEGGLGSKVVDDSNTRCIHPNPAVRAAYDNYDVNLRARLKDLLGKAGLDIAPVVEGILGEQKKLNDALQATLNLSRIDNIKLRKELSVTKEDSSEYWFSQYAATKAALNNLATEENAEHERRLDLELELAQADREIDALQTRNDNQFAMIQEKDKMIEDLQKRIRNLVS